MGLQHSVCLPLGHDPVQCVPGPKALPVHSAQPGHRGPRGDRQEGQPSGAVLRLAQVPSDCSQVIHAFCDRQLCRLVRAAVVYLGLVRQQQSDAREQARSYAVRMQHRGRYQRSVCSQAGGPYRLDLDDGAHASAIQYTAITGSTDAHTGTGYCNVMLALQHQPNGCSYTQRLCSRCS